MTKLTPSTMVWELCKELLPSITDEVNDKLTDICNNAACQILEEIEADTENFDWTDEHGELTDWFFKHILEELNK